jgi:hypothetical protein
MVFERPATCRFAVTARSKGCGRARYRKRVRTFRETDGDVTYYFLAWTECAPYGNVCSGPSWRTWDAAATAPFGKFSLDESFDVGEDTGTPVIDDYDAKMPFKFTGKLEKVENSSDKRGRMSDTVLRMQSAARRHAVVGSHVRYWHKADIKSVVNHVRFQG